MKRIYIPNYDGNSVSDSILSLIKIVNETNMATGNVSWDFSRVSDMHPFLVAPLAIYKATSTKQIVCENMSLPMQSFLNEVFFEKMLHFENEAMETAEMVMSKYAHNLYIPICSFTMSESNKEAFGVIARNLILQQNKFYRSLSTPLSYFLSELIDNIYEHSDSVNGYLYSQYVEKENSLYICIADAGITIFKSYEKAKKYLQEIDNNESEALRFANEGRSTKNRPGAESRGYGISTTRKMLVEGLGGSFYMLSGSAFHRYESKEINSYVDMRNFFKWNGTLLVLRVPADIPHGFNYINYLE